MDYLGSCSSDYPQNDYPNCSTNSAYVVERLGKYSSTLEAGIHILMPFIDKVAYQHSLKEIAVDVPSQQTITKDNVAVKIDGVLYLKIMDAKLASYGVDNLFFAITQLAQTSMRSEIGKLSLDQTFESRGNVNAKLEEMEKQMTAERELRVAVTTSEGYKQAQINEADVDRQANIVRAQGIAKSLIVESQTRAESIREISKAINEDGISAVSQQLAEQYIKAFEKLA